MLIAKLVQARLVSISLIIPELHLGKLWATVQHPAVVQSALPSGWKEGGFARMFFDYAEVLI